MPTLNWIGKDKVVSHHQDVPYRVLEHKYHFDAEKGETSCLPAQALAKAGNKIIHGDNLEALKSLLPEYEGKIKCIYIDPPYNTGNENWVYNDNVNHPKKGFVNLYSTLGAEEDRAEIVALMMNYNEQKVLLGFAKQDRVLKRKVKLILKEMNMVNEAKPITWKKIKNTYNTM